VAVLLVLVRTSSLLFEAFDVNNISLGSVSSLFAANLALSGDTGSAPNELLQLTLAGISYITITGDVSGGSFVLDDLTFGTPSVSPVPEPSTLSLLLLGACGVAWRVRKLQRSLTVDSGSRRL
jgi:hypothetical protein